MAASDIQANHITVHPYSIDGLCELLQKFLESVGIAEPAILQKYHIGYFKDYFGHPSIDAKTIVVESFYIDRDFIEDYSAHYVRCMPGKYERFCSRFHFFNRTFTDDDLKNAALGNPECGLTDKDLNDAYLGFVVVKPLPGSFVGRTCLKTYSDDNERRCYPVTREYTAHLLGMNLTVHSLAFQEQDSVVAACATSALWSAFQGTAILFHHRMCAPVEITRIATAEQGRMSRAIPNHGLTVPLMANAIKKVGLEPEVYGVKTSETLTGISYAYLKGGIPLILIGSLHDKSKDQTYLGHHAVAITGYSKGKAFPSPYPITETAFSSNRIDKLYVHDDQVGPFSRITLDNTAPDFFDPYTNEPVDFSLKTSWMNGNGDIDTVWFCPETLIVPLYHKIRISYESILKTVLVHDERVEAYRAANSSPLTQRIEWEVFLTRVSTLKSHLRNAKPQLLDEAELYKLLSAPRWPRFIWRAIAFDEGEPVFETLFDATDIEQGDFLLHTIIYDEARGGTIDEAIAIGAATS